MKGNYHSMNGILCWVSFLLRFIVLCLFIYCLELNSNTNDTAHIQAVDERQRPHRKLTQHITQSHQL